MFLILFVTYTLLPDAGMVDQTEFPGRIEEMDYQGNNRRAVKFLTPNGARPWSISMFEDSYYWTDSHDNQEALFKCNRFVTASVVCNSFLTVS